MKTVVLIIRRASLAQGLMAKMRGNPGVQICYEPDYANADGTIRRCHAAGALLEVSEDGACPIADCLALCARLRASAPECRLLLMCPESQQNTVEQVIAAKQQKLIDDFVFYDVTLDYLAASLEAL